MPTAFDELTGEEVDTASEAWRHRCECAWLLENKPTRIDKHLYLYGVRDRDQLMDWSNEKQAAVLAEDWAKRVVTESKPLIAHRGLAAADRILDGAKKLWEARNDRAA